MNQLPLRKRFFSLLLLCFFISSSTPVIAQQPNIIYVMSDDMGYADLSCYGRKDYKTPNLDRLASQGMKFTQAYSAGPLCTPTRVGFMTGRYPARTPVGLIEPLTPSKRDSAFGWSADYPSVAALVKKSGYETVLIGKWHLGFMPEHRPTKNGFDYFFGIHSGAADYISHKNGDGRTPDLYENDKQVEVDGYLTDLLTQKAVSFLKQKHTRPFFLTLNYNAPHWPWQGPTDKAYNDTVGFRLGGSPAIYAAMMKSLDEGVGEVLKVLDEQGLTDQTLFIFTNDNGGERYSDNGGLSKSKGTLWEGGIRVPAFARWPGKIAAGSSSEQAIITMDWTATIMAAANANPQTNFPLDGINLLPLLTGKQKEMDRTLYWRTFQRTRQKAMREGKWKYLQDEDGEYLFDLLADPAERNNLKAFDAALFQRLKTKYDAWEKTVLKPIPL